MKLSQLLKESRRADPANDPDITHITHDARQVRPGSLFVAIPGYSYDGRQFISLAEEQGAAAILTQGPAKSRLPCRLVKDARTAMAEASAGLYRHPAKDLSIIGITGTKGKTSVCHLLYDTAVKAGKKPGRIGTNGVRYGDISYDIANTTPESSDLHRILRDMKEAGVDTVFMEVSSGGLKLARVAGIEFTVGIFTNLAEDHLGPSEHADMKEYAYWKSRLMKQSRTALISADDPRADAMRGLARRDALYGSRGDFTARNLRPGDRLAEPTRFDFSGKETYPVALALPGRFNVENALAVLGCAELLGYPKEAALQVLKEARVPGRTELLPSPAGTQVVLDYAHNGLSLSSVLDTLSLYRPGRLLVLMGTVGGRTKTRRRELGDAAARRADVVMLTSDNPDYEDPNAIIADMAASFHGTEITVYREPDRKKAIEFLLDRLVPGDILLLAGKGHEEFQLVCGREIPHSDRAVVENYLSAQEVHKDCGNDGTGYTKRE